MTPAVVIEMKDGLEEPLCNKISYVMAVEHKDYDYVHAKVDNVTNPALIS
jgi:hypothetical protein